MNVAHLFNARHVAQLMVCLRVPSCAPMIVPFVTHVMNAFVFMSQRGPRASMHLNMIAVLGFHNTFLGLWFKERFNPPRSVPPRPRVDRSYVAAGQERLVQCSPRRPEVLPRPFGATLGGLHDSSGGAYA